MSGPANKDPKGFSIPMNGQVIQSDDPAVIGSNFQSLKNMEYTDTHPKAIQGMAKINTTALTNGKVRGMFHYKKSQPAETHLMTQVRGDESHQAYVIDNGTAIPSQGNFDTEALGSELLTNGSFTGALTGWTALDGVWTYGSNKALCDGSTISYIYQTVVLEKNAVYKVTFDVSNYVSGSVYADLYDSSSAVHFSGSTVAANGSYAQYLVCPEEGANLFSMINAANSDFDIDNVSLKKVTSVLWGDSYGAGTGRFSDAPDGAMIYCNEKETMVYGGDESRIAAFINKSANHDFEYDFTSAVQNTLTDAENVATMYRYEETIDTDTMLLLDFENDLDDQSVSNHVPTNTDVTFDSLIPKVGSYCASFNGTSSYLLIDDSADFYFSNNTFTIEFWYKSNGITSVNQSLFYMQLTDDQNYMRIYLTRTGSSPQSYKYYVHFKVYLSGIIVDLSSQITPGNWQHIACCRDDTNWYLFVDGNLASSTVVSPTHTAQDYGNVNIGRTTGGTNFFNGYMDELRISDVCRYTGDFTVRTLPFGTQDNSVLYVGTLRPIEAIKLYIGTANTTTATASYVEHWSSSGWMRCTNVVDGTSSGGKTLAATGSITFDSTVSTARPTIINNRFLYWYRIMFVDNDETTTIYYATVKAPFQSLKDIWDGSLRTILSYKTYKSSKFYDYTVNVASDTYSSTDASTYGIGTIETSTGYIYMGFDERMTGVYISYPEDKINAVASTDLTVEYYDGEDWQAVSGLSDGTAEGGISSGKTGYISWNSPEPYQEFRKSLSKGPSLFYYRLSYSQTLTDAIRVSYVGGIPAQKTIPGYRFAFMDANRLYLCSETSNNKNEILALKAETNCVANGEDSVKISFGDENPVTAGGNLYAQLGSNIYDIKVICKESEVWMLNGKSPKDFEKRKIYANDGCVSPMTFDTAVVNIGGTYRPVAIWQGANGLYLYDGSTVVPISRDISQFFDPYAETKINSSMIHKSVGVINPAKSRYHWLFASGSETTLNKEWVYDIVRNKWFEIDRTYKLQTLAKVVDTYGNIYMYGAEDRGYIQRLDYGVTWDGEDMDFSLHTSDFMLMPDTETLISELQVKMLAKDADNMVKITHYGDTNELGTEMLLSPSNEGHRLTDEVLGTNLGNYVYHSFKIETSTNGEDVAFEPIGINGKFIPIREHRR